MQIIDSHNKVISGKIEDIIIHILHHIDIDFYKIDSLGNRSKINKDIVRNVQFICHRINTVSELENIPEMFGVELDIRDNAETGELILVHDPYTKGELFENYLKLYGNRNTLILNIKSERTEIKCLELLQKYEITNFFFLDSSFPMINLLNTKYNCNKVASRFSEYEILESSKQIHGFIQWVWVDCFTKFPLDQKSYDEMKDMNKKICLVSPELQGQKEKISEYRNYIIEHNLIPDAICCKKANIIEWL